MLIPRRITSHLFFIILGSCIGSSARASNWENIYTHTYKSGDTRIVGAQWYIDVDSIKALPRRGYYDLVVKNEYAAPKVSGETNSMMHYFANCDLMHVFVYRWEAFDDAGQKLDQKVILPDRDEAIAEYQKNWGVMNRDAASAEKGICRVIWRLQEERKLLDGTNRKDSAAQSESPPKKVAKKKPPQSTEAIQSEPPVTIKRGLMPR